MYELKKPYTNKQRCDFIVKYNHNQGLLIKETEEGLVAYEREVPFEEERDWRLGLVRNWADQTLAVYKADCSQSEIQTWDRQESGARALVADENDTSADAEFVRQLASARGITTAELVEKIMRKVELYTAGSAKVLGRQQQFEDKINSCATIEELRAIELPTVSNE
jgi:hypothetical protein